MRKAEKVKALELQQALPKSTMMTRGAIIDRARDTERKDEERDERTVRKTQIEELYQTQAVGPATGPLT